MRIVTGKSTRQIDAAEVAAWMAIYREITVDLGAGDGRFVRDLATKHPGFGAIAVDLCEANLKRSSRAGAANALFVVADALALPSALSGVATRVTIHFPWGSLLHGLLGGHRGFLCGLEAMRGGRSTLDIMLNAGALAEAGWALESGGERVAAVLREAGLIVAAPRVLGAAELRRSPTTWGKRLAFGRDPRAIRIEAALSSSDGASARRRMTQSSSALADGARYGRVAPV